MATGVCGARLGSWRRRASRCRWWTRGGCRGINKKMKPRTFQNALFRKHVAWSSGTYQRPPPPSPLLRGLEPTTARRYDAGPRSQPSVSFPSPLRHRGFSAGQPIFFLSALFRPGPFRTHLSWTFPATPGKRDPSRLTCLLTGLISGKRAISSLDKASLLEVNDLLEVPKLSFLPSPSQVHVLAPRD